MRLATDVDPTRLTLTPEEGFLLSRVDGCASLGELLKSTGLPEAQVIPLVRSLKEKGVLETPDAGGAKAAEPAPKPKAKPEKKSRYDGFIFNLTDLNEDVELDVDLRKEILFLHGHLGDFNYYDLLGVRPRTSNEDIRARYFELSRRFHPDRYYGKRLGSYKGRLSQVFQAVHEAYETLGDKKKKTEYDKVTDVPLTEEELDEIARAQEAQVRESKRGQERRERLRRTSRLGKLVGRAKHLVEEADAAEGRGDLKQAASLLKLATTFDPNSARLAERAKEMEVRAKATELDELLGKAHIADTLGNLDMAEAHLEAAVALEAPDPRGHIAYVRHLLARGKRHEKALEAARRAVEIGPRSAEAFTVLGHALVATGDKKEARAAYQRAATLDATADEAKEALKSLRWSLF